MDESNVVFYNMYSLVRNQVRVSSIGDLIDLDYAAVLNTIKLYVDADGIKKTFERVLECFDIEREFTR